MQTDIVQSKLNTLKLELKSHEFWVERHKEHIVDLRLDISILEQELSEYAWADGLSMRTMNALHRGGVKTLAQAQTMTDEQLLAIRGLGKGTLEEIRAAAAALSEMPEAV